MTVMQDPAWQPLKVGVSPRLGQETDNFFKEI